MEPRHVIEALRQPEGLGKAETARRLAQLLRRIFGYGVQTGQLTRNPVADIRTRVCACGCAERAGSHRLGLGAASGGTHRLADAAAGLRT
jgi:hypothetical protein